MLIYLFVLHFIADFLLQSREMGKKKSVEFNWLAKHLAIQFAIFLVGLSIFNVECTVEFAGLNAIIHGIIDWNIWKLYKVSVYLRDKTATPETWKYWDDHWFYATIGLDQLLHAITLIGLYQWLS
jgi:hypothetical protein